MRWTYWDNSESWHGRLIIIVDAPCISIADEIFQYTTNIDPCRSYIEVALEKGCDG